MATTTHHLRLLSSAFKVPLRGDPSIVHRCIFNTSRAVSQGRRTLTSLPIINNKSSFLRVNIFKTRNNYQCQKHNITFGSQPYNSSAQRRHASTLDGVVELSGSSLSEASTIQSTTKEGFFPKTTEKAVAYWLFGTAGLVFGIVVLGGLTRLTESGLSITEWKPVTGVFPPLNTSDWQAEFTKYQDSPEYRILNPNMTLSQYKFIYWMEWSHRIMGRVIGLSFVIPAVYFVARRKVSAKVSLGLLGIAAGIGTQGVIGWWMVKSGLQDDLFQQPGSVPRVSQYRLTAHLGTAIAVYAAMIWTGLSVLRQNGTVGVKQLDVQHIKPTQLKAFKTASVVFTCLVFLTALSGGLVAGLDAGLIYNEFPYMGQGIVPPTNELFNTFYSHTPSPHSDIYWRNMLENPTTVQFQHRVLATTTFFSSIALWMVSRRIKVPVYMGRWVNHVLYFVGLQVALGITTLLYMVPTSVAAAHQANSLLVLASCLVLCSRFGKLGPRQMKVVGEMVKRNAVGMGR